MKVFNVNHIGIDTLDFEASIAFYQDVMGMEILGEYDLGGDYVAYVKAGDGTTVELFRPVTSESPTVERHLGLKHLAFNVDNVDEWATCLKGKGYPITFGPADLPPINSRVLLFQAPDNVIIELCMPMSEK